MLTWSKKGASNERVTNRGVATRDLQFKVKKHKKKKIKKKFTIHKNKKFKKRHDKKNIKKNISDFIFTPVCLYERVTADGNTRDYNLALGARGSFVSSITVAFAVPPPSQIASTPYRPFVRSNS